MTWNKEITSKPKYYKLSLASINSLQLWISNSRPRSKHHRPHQVSLVLIVSTRDSWQFPFICLTKCEVSFWKSLNTVKCQSVIKIKLHASTDKKRTYIYVGQQKAVNDDDKFKLVWQVKQTPAKSNKQWKKQWEKEIWRTRWHFQRKSDRFTSLVEVHVW